MVLATTTNPATTEYLRQQIIRQVQRGSQAYIQRAQAGEFDPTGGVSAPYTWWNIWALGPFLSPPPAAPGGDSIAYKPLSKSPDGQVLPANTKAFVATIIYLNPDEILSPNNLLSPGTVLSNFGLPYEITYNTANLSSWNLTDLKVDGQDVTNPTRRGYLVPGTNFYVDILEFSCLTEGLMEMNITARLLGDNDGSNPNAPQFAAFANWVYDFNDRQLENAFIKGNHPANPLKFLVYKTTV